MFNSYYGHISRSRLQNNNITFKKNTAVIYNLFLSCCRIGGHPSTYQHVNTPLNKVIPKLINIINTLLCCIDCLLN